MSGRNLSIGFCLLGLAAIAGMAACGAGSQPNSIVPEVANPSAKREGSPTYKSLHLFKGGEDGANPYDALTPFNGSLYGVTYGNKIGSAGFGTVFRVAPSGTETVIYRFKGYPTDGAEPVGKLTVLDGTFYGTTYNGGSKNFGSVFAISPAGKEHLVYSFQGGSDGTNPGAGLTFVGGKLYGTTVDAGGPSQGGGTVFAVTTSGQEHVLHTFAGYPSDGETPYCELLAENGELFGTTQDGGANRYGSVFAISTAGKERLVYSFGTPPDAALPIGGLIKDGDSFYGTTEEGGASNAGAIFAVTGSGKERVVYSFKGAPSDGSTPRDSLLNVNGVLYGATYSGGASSMGSVFESSTNGSEKMLYSFKGEPKDGANPYGGLVSLKGVLYGTALNGGVHTGGATHPYGGSIYKVTL